LQISNKYNCGKHGFRMNAAVADQPEQKLASNQASWAESPGVEAGGDTQPVGISGGE
jgi:hypothetical protein